MKSRITTCIAAMTILAVLAVPVRLAAQEHKQELPRYTVTDLGTLGGTNSGANGLNKNGQVDGTSTLPGDTAEHAFLWRHGRMIDLGTLGGPNSTANWPLNDWGGVPVNSDTTTPDPNGEDYCSFGTYLICRSFVWYDGVMITLPTLGGNNTYSAQLNNRGQMAGASEIDWPDPSCAPPQVLAERPVIWEQGRVRELPILPGDSVGAAFVINDRGQAAGLSSPDCYTITWHALLWEHGAATDLGNLGGQSYNLPQAINNRTQVVGGSDLLGDTAQHAFLWENGAMTDLGTLPSHPNSIAEDINDEGHVVGGACDQPLLTGNCSAFLWQDGAMTNLNALIPSESPLFLWYAAGINSRGQITGMALEISSGEMHAFLATPVEGESHVPAASAQTRESPKVVLPDSVRRLLRQRRGFGRFGTGMIGPE